MYACQRKVYLSPRAMVSFQRAKKLSSSLVRPKLYLSERISDSFKYKGNKLQVCLNVNDTNAFGSTG